MKFKSKINTIQKEYGTEKFSVSFFVYSESEIKAIEELKTDFIEIDIKKYNKKRTLDANAYFWVLVGEIAKKMNTKNTLIYKDLIQHSGIYDVIPIKDIAVKRFCESWENKGLGWVTMTEKSKLEGYTNIIAFYGSSVYSNSEMSRLIDSAIEECKQLGIPTIKDEELQKIKGNWKNEKL